MTILGVAIALDATLALAAAAVLAGGFLRGFAGFGSALVIIPVLAVLFEPRAAVVMHAIMEVPVILNLARSAIGDSRRATVGPMLIAMVLTTPIGAIALAVADPDAMKLAISLVVLAMVALIAAGGRLTALASRWGSIGAGAVGGLVQGATGIGGPPVVTALLARRDAARETRGNVVAVMSSMIAVSLATFAAYGFVDRQTLVIGALAAPLCLAGTILGARAFAASGGGQHRAVALAIVAVMAVATSANALSDIQAGP